MFIISREVVDNNLTPNTAVDIEDSLGEEDHEVSEDSLEDHHEISDVKITNVKLYHRFSLYINILLWLLII